MNICIFGTRGIPNNYGGFEQFAQYLSVGLVNRGHKVWVYNGHDHPYKEETWKGVKIIHCYNPEDKFGTAGQFIYDFNCTLDSRSRDFDIILQLGYTSSSIWNWFFPKQSTIVTNMDGLEWKRSKYPYLIQRFLKWAEKLAVHYSDYLIADSIGIRDYLQNKYSVLSHYIPYGANLFSNPDEKVLEQFNLRPYSYDLLLARMEPENNIQTIIEGYLKASPKGKKLILIGNISNVFGQKIRDKYSSEKLDFWEPIYDINLLNNLRYFSDLYFHGHSVGGTNPSLLEAMASNALILAHDNVFNKSILGDDAFYFTDSDHIRNVVVEQSKQKDYTTQMLKNNFDKIEKIYSWDRIIEQCEQFFQKVKKSS